MFKCTHFDCNHQHFQLLISACVNIVLYTQQYADEITWTYGSCSQAQPLVNNQQYTVQCCQPAGTYDLKCMDSYGDGWSGAYLLFGTSTTRYCEDFNGGRTNFLKTVSITHPVSKR